jgi:hypothetical protein
MQVKPQKNYHPENNLIPSVPSYVNHLHISGLKRIRGTLFLRILRRVMLAQVALPSPFIITPTSSAHPHYFGMDDSVFNLITQLSSSQC